MKKVIGLGAGGHAKVVIEILSQSGDIYIAGLIDNNKELWNSKFLDIPVLGGDELLPKLYNQGLRYAFMGLGSVGNSKPRRELYEKVQQYGFEFINAIHPSAEISSSVEIGEGVAIMANVVINAYTKIGKNVIINTGSIIEHDCDIRDHVHIASGAVLAGGIKVNEGAHIGSGANLIQGIKIEQNAIIGAGSLVLKDVEQDTVVVGNPARVLRNREDS